MGVKVEIGTMSVQSTSAKSVLDEQVKTCQLLIERFNQFCEDDSLKGKGYTSAKQYSQSVYLPLLNGMLIYLETLVKLFLACILSILARSVMKV